MCDSSSFISRKKNLNILPRKLFINGCRVSDLIRQCIPLEMIFQFEYTYGI